MAKFDLDGDGQLSDEERRAMRQFIKQNRTGSRGPSNANQGQTNGRGSRGPGFWERGRAPQSLVLMSSPSEGALATEGSCRHRSFAFPCSGDCASRTVSLTAQLGVVAPHTDRHSSGRYRSPQDNVPVPRSSPLSSQNFPKLLSVHHE